MNSKETSEGESLVKIEITMRKQVCENCCMVQHHDQQLGQAMDCEHESVALNPGRVHPKGDDENKNNQSSSSRE